MLDVDKLKLKGFTVNDYNQINTLEFSYPYKEMINILKESDYPDVDEIMELRGNKRNVNIQFTLDNEKLENVVSLLIDEPNCVESTVFDAGLDYLTEQTDDIEDKINYIVYNKDILLEALNTINKDMENSRFSNYTSGYEVGNDENNIDKYSMGKKADILPDLDDYDGNYEDDYYDR